MITNKYSRLSNYILPIFIFTIIVFIIVILQKQNQKQNQNNNILEIKSPFINRNDPDFEDGKMNFNYLVDPNYTNNILRNYYIDDDIKINGYRVVIHPNQTVHNTGGKRRNRYYYGNIPDLNYSDLVYNSYGIRL